VELPSPYAGRVGALLVAEGDTVAVGTPILRVDPVGSEDAAPSNGVLVGYGPREEAAGARRRRRAASPESPPPPESPASPATPSPARTAVLAKPPVRKFAKDHGVDLREVAASDPSGIVSRADVEAHLAAQRVDDRPERARRVPIAGVRRQTAEAMVRSAFTAPHVTEWVTVDVSATVELVERLRADREFADVKVTPTLIVAKAVCLALRRTPDLHARWDDDAQEIVFPEHVGLGV